MSAALAKNGPVHATDLCLPLISLYRAVRNGWVPPNHVSREEYELSKSLPDTDPMKAFCGFGCSFGGKWFGGYAGQRRDRPEHGIRGLTWAASAARSLAKQVRLVSGFDWVDFLSIEPRVTDAIIYCDPPYAGTTEFSAVAGFDHRLFIRRVMEWSRFTSVFVSEYSFDAGTLQWEAKASGSCGLAPKATERLFLCRPGDPLK
jgi:DNA adenine methylase